MKEAPIYCYFRVCSETMIQEENLTDVELVEEMKSSQERSIKASTCCDIFQGNQVAKGVAFVSDYRFRYCYNN